MQTKKRIDFRKNEKKKSLEIAISSSGNNNFKKLCGNLKKK